MSEHRWKRHLGWLPNALTLANLGLGFLALVFYQAGYSLLTLLALMLAAGLADLLDGAAARWLGRTSLLGAQLDSLADLVTFGVVPAAVGFGVANAMVATLLEAFSPVITKLLLALPFVAYLLAAAFRLARFNVKVGKSRSFFSGLPSPAAGLLLIGTLWAFSSDRAPLNQAGGLYSVSWVLTTAVGLGVLMISGLPFLSIKGDLRLTWSYWLRALVPAALSPFWLGPWSVLLLTVTYALASSLAYRALYHQARTSKG